MLRSLAPVFLAAAFSIPAAAQVSDGTNASYVPAGGTGTLNHFGTCIKVTNASSRNVQFMFGDQASWNTFLAHPAPGVTYSPCSSSACSAQNVTWTAGWVSCTAAFTAASNGQSETLFALAGVDGSSGGGEAQAACTNGTVNVTPLTCSAGSSTPASCTFNGTTYSNGQTWSGTETNSEACSTYNPAYTSGTAVETTPVTYECENGSSVVISTGTGTWNTAQCSNSGGGTCVPISASVCTAQNTSEPYPACQWTAPAQYLTQVNRIGQQECWYAAESKSYLTYSLSADQCSCVAKIVEIGQIAEEGPLACGQPVTAAFPATGCPNSTGGCTVQPITPTGTASCSAP